jgi:WD40 repeat protein
LESPVITAMALAPGGGYLAVAGDDHSVRLVDAASGDELGRQTTHGDWVRSLAFSPGGRHLASCGQDGKVSVWAMAANAGELQLLTEHVVDHALFGVAFASEDELYAVGFGDAIYRLDLGSDRWQVDHRCECKDLRAIDISRDGRWLAYGGRDGIVRLHGLVGSEHVLAKAEQGEVLRPASKISPPLHFERILSVRFSEDGGSVYSCGADRRLVKWDIGSNRMLASFEVQAGKLMAVCPLESGEIAVSGSDNTIRIIDRDISREVAKWVGHDGSVAVLCRNATHMYSGGYDATVRSWSIQESIRSLDGGGRFVHPVSAQFEDSSSREPIR